MIIWQIRSLNNLCSRLQDKQRRSTFEWRIVVILSFRNESLWNNFQIWKKRNWMFYVLIFYRRFVYIGGKLLHYFGSGKRFSYNGKSCVRFCHIKLSIFNIQHDCTVCLYFILPRNSMYIHSDVWLGFYLCLKVLLQTSQKQK